MLPTLVKPQFHFQLILSQLKYWLIPTLNSRMTLRENLSLKLCLKSYLLLYKIQFSLCYQPPLLTKMKNLQPSWKCRLLMNPKLPLLLMLQLKKVFSSYVLFQRIPSNSKYTCKYLRAVLKTLTKNGQSWQHWLNLTNVLFFNTIGRTMIFSLNIVNQDLLGASIKVITRSEFLSSCKMATNTNCTQFIIFTFREKVRVKDRRL